jgi:hypothetical protein
VRLVRLGAAKPEENCVFDRASITCFRNFTG